MFRECSPPGTKSYFYQKIEANFYNILLSIFITRGLYIKMSTSIVKQMLINKLDVSSDDLLDSIKSFCFYDAKTWETISFIKTKKERINYLLKNETFSRANPVYDDDEEVWAFWVEDETDGPNPQFQAINCRVCGNYISINPNIPINIKCHCHINEDNWDDDDEDWVDSDSDDDSDDDDWEEDWIDENWVPVENDA
jgi:hypothetical protein